MLEVVPARAELNRTTQCNPDGFYYATIWADAQDLFTIFSPLGCDSGRHPTRSKVSVSRRWFCLAEGRACFRLRICSAK
jgi:hypothetical protein